MMKRILSLCGCFLLLCGCNNDFKESKSHVILLNRKNEMLDLIDSVYMTMNELDSIILTSKCACRLEVEFNAIELAKQLYLLKERVIEFDSIYNHRCLELLKLGSQNSFLNNRNKINLN